MLILDRRYLLTQTGMSIFSSFVVTNESQNFISHTRAIEKSLIESVNIICDFCPIEFRKSVRDSGGHFLYRGEEGIVKPTILSPEPDLLIFETYNDWNALQYFMCLENQLVENIHLVRPSIGHIGTSNIHEAEPWGVPVSVWPIGSSISYIWPEKRSSLYPGRCPDHDIVFSADLTTALKSGKEVLFSTSLDEKSKGTFPKIKASSFLCIPASWDQSLRINLSRKDFGLMR